MKLNYKRTFFVGFAFLSICAFWQLYDTMIPLILQNTFKFKETQTGIIMALDNVLALFMLPMLGALSDRIDTPIGKRTPFILVGTFFSVIFLFIIPIANEKKNFILFVICLGLVLLSMGLYRSPAVALMPDLTPKSLRSKANAVINLMGAVGGIYALLMIKNLIKKEDNPNYLPVFIAIAIIMVLAVVVLLFTVNEKKLVDEINRLEIRDELENEIILNTRLEADVQGIDGVGIEGHGYVGQRIDSQGIKNKAINNQVIDNQRTNNSGINDIKTTDSIINPRTTQDEWNEQKEDKSVKRSLVFILASVFLWFTAYNAISTAFSRYASVVFGLQGGSFADCLMVGTIVAIISYIPIGIISSYYGRKKVIIMGIILMTISYGVGFLFTSYSVYMNVLFATTGIGWAAISVNSYPMVVEMSKGSDIGKYTGLYYTFSMSAQILTPILSGFLLQKISYRTLFPYAMFFSLLSLGTMLCVHHGDTKPLRKKEILENFDLDD